MVDVGIADSVYKNELRRRGAEKRDGIEQSLDVLVSAEDPAGPRSGAGRDAGPARKRWSSGAERIGEDPGRSPRSAPPDAPLLPAPLPAGPQVPGDRHGHEHLDRDGQGAPAPGPQAAHRQAGRRTEGGAHRDRRCQSLWTGSSQPLAGAGPSPDPAEHPSEGMLSAYARGSLPKRGAGGPGAPRRLRALPGSAAGVCELR